MSDNAQEVFSKLKKKYSGRIRIAQQKVARELAVALVDLLKLRTRIQKEGTNGPLKDLKASTIKQRERYSDNLHPDTDPSTSNLTATGQLLDALRGRAGGGKVTIDIKPTKRKRGLSGAKSSLTNEDVRKYVEDNGREFLKLSSAEKDEVVKLATEMFNEELQGLS